jgi:hypothetical protein
LPVQSRRWALLLLGAVMIIHSSCCEGGKDGPGHRLNQTCSFVVQPRKKWCSFSGVWKQWRQVASSIRFRDRWWVRSLVERQSCSILHQIVVALYVNLIRDNFFHVRLGRHQPKGIRCGGRGWLRPKKQEIKWRRPN